jgi:hypothetical protein
MSYDEGRDAFIPEKPAVGNWYLDEETCRWFEEPEEPVTP